MVARDVEVAHDEERVGVVALGEDGHIHCAGEDRPLSFRFSACGIPFEADIADRNAPLAMGGYMAEQLPNSYLHILPGEGHFSVAVRHMPAILQTLVVPEDFARDEYENRPGKSTYRL